LLASRNFAIASVLFFVFGFGLFGSTTLLPQILQSLYGYRAIDAGLVLSPDALVITLLAPDRSAVDPAPDCACPRIARDQPPHYRCCEVALQYLLSRDRLQTLCPSKGLSRAWIRISSLCLSTCLRIRSLGRTRTTRLQASLSPRLRRSN
jgi:hypothetical protein